MSCHPTRVGCCSKIRKRPQLKPSLRRRAPQSLRAGCAGVACSKTPFSGIPRSIPRARGAPGPPRPAKPARLDVITPRVCRAGRTRELRKQGQTVNSKEMQGESGPAERVRTRLGAAGQRGRLAGMRARFQVSGTASVGRPRRVAGPRPLRVDTQYAPGDEDPGPSATQWPSPILRSPPNRENACPSRGRSARRREPAPWAGRTGPDETVANPAAGSRPGRRPGARC